MKSVQELVPSLLFTFVLLTGIGFVASMVPSNAATDDEPPVNVNEAVTSGLHLEVTGIRNDVGNIVVLVFGDKESYDRLDEERMADYRIVPAKAGRIVVPFPSLSDARHAIVLFHDENGDLDLNMNGLYPLEGYGISGASDAYDEPEFEEASVGPGQVSVPIHYL